jgi:hypothetical protein
MRVSDIPNVSGVSSDRTREAFSGWPMTIGWAAMILFALYASTHMVAAGDTWVAMACGRHFVHHGVDTVEPFSANSHKAGPTSEEVETWPAWARWITDKAGLETVRHWHPTGWVDQNWLTHVIFYKLATALGSETEPYYDALVYWKFAIYIIAAAALYCTSRIYGVNWALAVIFVCFALFVGRSFFDIRPAGFSNVLVAVLILVLALTSYRNALYVWLIVPLVVFWANVHGGYIYAFIVLVPFVAWHALMNLPRRWMVAAYSILLWLVLYGMGRQLLGHEPLRAVSLWKDVLFYFVVLAMAGSIALTASKKVSNDAIVPSHVVASCVLFLILLLRFFPSIPVDLGRGTQDDLETYIAGSRLAYLAVFVLAMMVGVVVLSLKDKVVKVMNVRGILHVVGAGIAAFVAMVVFNPFHLTNLTHTFVISVSKHAERWRDVNEWHRAFDWSNPVGTAAPFLVLYILAWFALLAWAILFLSSPRVFGTPANAKKKAAPPVSFTWPRIDLSLLVIAAMTVYMAIRSRRFIPIAGFVACPVLALLFDQGIRIASAMIQAARTGRHEVPAMPAILRLAIVAAGGLAVVAFGLVWGIRFHTVYMGPWPKDMQYTSLFMRMTASDAKPFAACEFIRKNKLSGKMFNYWTEGGFIAWGQDPDPNTGKVPLQLFMDGRAQAAYDVRIFDLWTDIISGGPAALPSLMERRQPTAEECTKISDWVTEQLRKYEVWVVLMPSDQFDKPFTDGLEFSRDWRTVYLDDQQKLFVDANSPQGKEFFQGMFTGKTTYPNPYSAKLTTGHNLLLSREVAQKRTGLRLLTGVMSQIPAPAPVLQTLMIGWQFPELRPQITETCQQYMQDFQRNQRVYAGQHGYAQRLEAVRSALMLLQEAAKSSRNMQLAETYGKQIESYDAQRAQILMSKRW